MASRQAIRQMRLAERRSRAFQLYVSGKTQVEIAAEFGVSNVQIHRDIQYELRRMNKDQEIRVDEYRRLQLERIHQLMGGLWTRARLGEADAAHALIRLLEREAKLLGLDAPTKVDLTARLEAMAAAEGWDVFEVQRTAEVVMKELTAG